MRIDIISAVPDLMESPFKTSILKRAMEKGLAEVHFHNVRDYAFNKHRQIDDTVYGGGAGMVMTCEPLDLCISKLKAERDYDDVIYLTPDGETFNQKIANTYSLKKNLILLCGHYEGIDQRVIDEIVDEEISIGDYVLTGGEIPAMVLVDSVSRYIQGVLKQESTQEESFTNNLLEYPQYTRPEEFHGQKVPEVLLSGHHENIRKWREQRSLEITKQKRPDLLK